MHCFFNALLYSVIFSQRSRVRVKISNSKILEWLTYISNFKINERSHVERPNLQESLQEKIKIDKKKKFIYINGQIKELAKLRVVEWTNYSKTC